jgi:hypothetical protein
MDSLLGAEARKSPAVDGVVNRDADGKEMRYPIILTPDEKRIARTVVLAFRQAMLTNAPLLTAEHLQCAALQSSPTVCFGRSD